MALSGIKTPLGCAAMVVFATSALSVPSVSNTTFTAFLFEKSSQNIESGLFDPSKVDIHQKLLDEIYLCEKDAQEQLKDLFKWEEE